MTIQTASQLQQIREQPHGTQLYLSVFRPKTIFACQVTGTYTFGDTRIYYDSVSTGSYLSLYPNGTVLIGTSQNSDDLGRIRLRNASGTYVTLAENSFSMVSGTYLTFLDYIDINAIYPKIVQDNSNPENVIFYKDFDIPYSNQNSVYGTFPCAGSHRATFVSSTGTVFYSATGTVNLASGTLSFLWDFEGGTPTGSTAHTPGYVAYGTPGHYKTKLTVTASGSAGITQDVTYRYVSVYDRIGQGINPPILKWHINEFSGSRSEGGYNVGIRLYENLGSIEPNALIVIFAEDTYGSNTVSFGGNAQNNSGIVFVGYVLENSIRFNYREGYVDFRCGSVTQLMKRAEGFSVSCESKQTPATWFELKNMTVQKALYHYLRWHSTVLDVTDFQYTGDDRLVQYFDSDRGSLYDAVNSFVEGGLLGETVSDRQGKIWAEISPPGYENPFTNIPFNFTLQKQDWMGEPDISEKRTGETSVVEMGGIVYDGDELGTFKAYLSTAPSLTPHYRGKVESSMEGMILLSQTQLNQIAGNYVASRNTNYGDVTILMNGNYRNIDIAPQERFFLDINASDTLTPKSLLGVSFRPVSMNWQYNQEKLLLYPQVSFQPVVTGTAGQTLLIPPLPPEIGYSYPSFNLPPLPYFTPSNVVQQVGRTVLMADGNLGFVYTKDFDSTNPTWIAWNTGLDADYQTSGNRQFFITPNGAVWLKLSGVGGKTYPYDRVYRASFVGGVFQKVIDLQFLIDNYPGFGGVVDRYRVSCIGYNPNKPEEVGIVMGAHRGDTLQTTVNLWVVNYPSMVKGTANISTTLRNGTLTFDTVNQKWFLIDDQIEGTPAFSYALYRLSYNGSSVENISNVIPTADNVHSITARDTGRTYLWGTTTTQLKATNDGGTTIENIGDNQQDGTSRWSYACDPSGQFVMGDWTAAAQKGESGDYGYTWVGLPTLPPGGAYVFAYAGSGGSGGWIAARGVVRYSPNFGNTWVSKEGNLLQIAPIPSIYGIFAKVDVRTI